MSRKTYSLSTETIKVLNGSATKVAEEFGCDPGYIHQILGQSVTDPFAKFEWLYAAAVRAGCDVSHWLNRLDAIRAKYYRMEPKNVGAETAKLIKEASDVAIAAVEDKTAEQRLIETDELIHQAEIQRKALILEIAHRDGRPVSLDIPRRANAA